jgi:hypothetical protein
MKWKGPAPDAKPAEKPPEPEVTVSESETSDADIGPAPESVSLDAMRADVAVTVFKMLYDRAKREGRV